MAALDHVQEKVFDPPINRGGEHSIYGRNDSLIIFKRDRPDAIESGYGTGPGAGTLHLVVGRKKQDTSFKDDSAFVYISMKTDVDKNLSIDSMTDGAGSAVSPLASTSAFIAKASAVRIVHKKDGDIRITSEDGKNFINMTKDGCEIKFGSSWLKMTDSKITIQGGNIEIGTDAVEKMILGTTFTQDFLAHTHVATFGPTLGVVPASVPNIAAGLHLSKFHSVK